MPGFRIVTVGSPVWEPICTPSEGESVTIVSRCRNNAHRDTPESGFGSRKSVLLAQFLQYIIVPCARARYALI